MADPKYFDFPNSETPIPLKKSAGLQIRKMSFQSEPVWVVKSPHDQEYHHLNEHEFGILCMLDGHASYRQIEETFNRQHSPFRVNFREITSVLTDFFQKSIVEPTSSGVAAGLHLHSREKRRQKLKQKFKRILAIQWKGWDPQWFLNLTFPYVSWFFSWQIVFSNLAMLAGVLMWMIIHYEEFFGRVPELWSFIESENWVSLGLAVAFTKLFHELGHAYTQKKFGGECHEIGIMIFFFMPTLYCNTSDSWLLGDKWKRMYIGLGGLYVELFIFTIAAIAWWNSSVGNLQDFFMNIMFVCSISAVLTNGNPLLKYDGYYILADWLEIPNLAQKSNKEIFRLFLFHGCGDQRKVDVWTSRFNKQTYVLYGITAFCFRLVLMLTISVFLVEYTRKIGLEFWGLMLAAFSTGTVFFQPIKAFVKHVREPGNWQQMKRKNLTVTTILLALFWFFVAFIPLPHWIPAECMVRFRSEANVFIQESGTLQEIHALPGDQLNAGDLILVLRDPKLEEELIRAERKVNRARIEVQSRLKQSSHNLDDDHEDLKSLRQKLAASSDALSKLQLKHAKMRVISPCDGLVVGVSPRLKKAESRDSTLNQQYGNLLDESNLYSTLHKGDPVCLLASCENEELSLVIEQRHSGSVRVGQPTKIMLSSHPRRLTGKILRTSSLESFVDDLPEQIAETSQGAAINLAKQLADPESAKKTSYKDGQSTSTTMVEAISSHSADQHLVYGSTGTAFVRVENKTLLQKFAVIVNETLLTSW